MIKGDNIILRTLRDQDIESFFDLSCVNSKELFWPFHLKSEAELLHQFKGGKLWSKKSGLMIITTLEGKIIGEINYFKDSWYLPGFELNFTIFKDRENFRIHGIEALDLFSNYLFELWPINRLEISNPIQNTFNRDIIVECNYKFEGLKRGCYFLGGEYKDMELFSLIRGEENLFKEAP